MTDDELAQLERLEQAAAKAPWFNDLGIVREKATGYTVADAEPSGAFLDQCEANAAFIAAVRNALPDLLAEVRRLRALAPVAAVAGQPGGVA